MTHLAVVRGEPRALRRVERGGDRGDARVAEHVAREVELGAAAREELAEHRAAVTLRVSEDGSLRTTSSF